MLYLLFNRVLGSLASFTSFAGIRTTCLLVFLSITSIQITAQEISVVVPVISTKLSNSRPANFNWEFESSGGGDVQIGQFACGSYWVAPANGDTGVKVLSLTGKTDDPNWHDFVSCDADPITENMGLLDGSNNYGNYDSAENIVPNLPLTFTPTSGSCISLVAAMQRNESETSSAGTSAIVGEAVDAYCVITIMPSPPANNGSDMIRPNTTGATKEFLTWADFDLDRIRTYPFMEGKSTEDWFIAQQRWRSSTEIFGLLAEVNTNIWEYFSEGGRAFRAGIIVDNYGAGMASAFYNDMLALFSEENTLEEKKPALAAMLSYGLDTYHARYDYGSNLPKAWTSGAGQRLGLFPATALLGSLLIDETIANVIRNAVIENHGDDVANLAPQEIRQITRGVTGVLLWGDGNPFIRNGNNLSEEDRRYWSNFKAGACFDTAVGTCDPGAGKKTMADPYGYIDGPAEKPGVSYMIVASGPIRALAATMLLMPEFHSVVNTDAPIEYIDRLVRHGRWTYPDPVAPVSITDQSNGSCNPWTGGSGCTDYFSTWGPDPSDVRFAIEDGVGRFHSWHGTSVTPSYESSRAYDNWTTLIEDFYYGDTYEANAVALGVVVSPEIFFEFGSSPKAHIFCATPDADIYYTTNGTDPTTSSTLYTGPISVSLSTEVRAKAYYSGYTASTVRTKICTTQPSGDFTAPSAPTGLAYSNPTVTTIDLSWNASSDNIGVVAYTIYVNGIPSPDPIPSTSTSTTVTGLNPGTNYAVTVSARDAVYNESNQSSAVSPTTVADTEAPSVPSGLTASFISPTTLQLDWIASSDNVAVDSYTVYVSGYSPIENIPVNGVLLTNLTPETLYTFTVAALDATANESSQSSSIQATTGALSDPPVIIGITVSNGDNPTNVIDGNTSTYWGAAGDPQWIQFELYQVATLESLDISFNHGTSRSYDFDIDVSTDGINWTNVFSGQSSGATNGLETFDTTDAAALFVRYIGHGNSTNSWNTLGEVVLLVSTIPDTTAPSIPTGLASSNITTSSVDLSWNASSDNVAVTAYNIYTNGSNPIQVTSTSTTISSLDPFTNYTFTVTAIDAQDNESSPSSGLPVTTADLSGPPSIVSITASDDSANVGNTIDSNLSTRWSAAGDPEWIQFEFDYESTLTSIDIAFYQGSTRIAYFDIQVSTDGTNWTTVFSGQSSGSSNALESFDTTDTTALYVRYLGHGNSSNSWNALTEVVITASINGLADTTAPSTPTSLTEVHTTATTANISWTGSTDNVGVVAYNVYTNGSNPIQVTSTSAAITGLSPNTGYTFTVTAEDAATNESSVSSVLGVTTEINGNNSIAQTTASEEDSGNVAVNTLDGSIATRWSAAGDPDWIQFELDGTYTLQWIDIAFYYGSSRSSYFDIQVSSDGTSWTTVYSGQSSGSSNALEYFDVTDTAASYIRYLGHGNSSNSWNSVTEIELGF